MKTQKLILIDQHSSYMKIILAIGAGSFIGGIARYLISVFINNKTISSFPFGTLAVNILGCFLIGLVYSLSEKGSVNNELGLFIATGILGGFTTFSAFSLETATMLREGHFSNALIYTALSIILGFAATIFGFFLIKFI